MILAMSKLNKQMSERTSSGWSWMVMVILVVTGFKPPGRAQEAPESHGVAQGITGVLKVLEASLADQNSGDCQTNKKNFNVYHCKMGHLD